MPALEIVARELAENTAAADNLPDSSAIPPQLGAYQLLAPLGRGGMGEVHLALDPRLGRKVAIKLLPAQFTADSHRVGRFAQEARAASALNHPNIINVIDSGISHEGIAYLVMELLQGHTLYEEVARKRPLPLKRCLKVLIPVCNALAEAHRNGIVHRDIKPSNIFLNRAIEGEVVKVVDFGTAKLLDASGSEEYERLTATGALIGTPNYLSPERIGGMDYDGRSDVYAVGVVFFQMMCGRVPFQSSEGNSMTVLYAHLNTQPPSPSAFNSSIVPEVEGAILQALEKAPEKRPTASDFAARLEMLWQHVPVEDLSASDIGWFPQSGDHDADFPTLGHPSEFEQAPITQKYSGSEDETTAFPTSTLNEPTLSEIEDPAVPSE